MDGALFFHNICLGITYLYFYSLKQVLECSVQTIGGPGFHACMTPFFPLSDIFGLFIASKLLLFVCAFDRFEEQNSNNDGIREFKKN